RDLRAGEQIRTAGRGGNVRAQPESLTEVVDVREVVEDAPIPEHDETAPRNGAEQLEESLVTRTVDTGGTRDDELDAGARSGLASHIFPFELRLLINVARAQRCVFGRGRMLDISVHTDRAAMNDAPYARTRCGLDDEADRGGVHGPVVAGRKTGG